MSSKQIPSNQMDIAWNYVTLSNPKNPYVDFFCFYGKIKNGGIYRNKIHLVGAIEK